MKKGLLFTLLALAAAFALGVARASAQQARIIWPADSGPVVTSAPARYTVPPVGLYTMPIDWTLLGFTAAEIADVGPTDDVIVNSSVTAKLIVGNDPLSCPDAQYPTIQDAVNAAPSGAEITVCPGTYVEQVVIPAGKNDLKLKSKKPRKAVIQAPALMTPSKTIVEVQAQNTRIQQFTIQGPGSGPCDSLEYGVLVNTNGSAVIEHNHIAHIRDNPFSGCQNGIAVRFGRQALATTGSGTVHHNLIDDYQKGGVVVDNTGSNAVVEKNIVKGFGPTAVTAQNGIQISRGATAQVKNNKVSDNIYTPMTVSATGVLLFQAGATNVEHNRVHANDIGIYAFVTDSGTTVQKNGTVASTFDGITLQGSTGTKIHENQTRNNDFGIGVYDTTGALLNNNHAKDNRTNGFFADVDTSGNTFQENEASNTDTGGFDCRDDSSGGGTAGTANFWLKDKGKTSSPAGICKK